MYDVVIVVDVSQPSHGLLIPIAIVDKIQPSQVHKGWQYLLIKAM
jgi:PDZ domain-containing secreted protein